jgi:NTP pyrophosphatase (non-canonical NTP hydrolase)
MHRIACEHGFHDNDGVVDMVPRMAMYCANIHGEVTELWEATRRGQLFQPCDKPGCDLTCLEEELADIVIRAMDAAVALNVDLGRAIQRKSKYNNGREFMNGGKKA